MDIKLICEIAFAVIMVIALAILYRKNYLDEQYLAGLELYLDELDDGTGLVSVLAEYAKIAVRAVEQMVKAGVIPKENEARKKTAEQLVADYALADGVKLTDEDKETASSLIEAEVYELKK